MPKVFRYRLKPTKSQVAILNRQLDLCRWVYNETLALRKNAWEKEDRSISYFESKKMLPIWKESKPELTEVYSQVLQEVVQRVDLAFKAFFRRVENGEDPGYPRFKGINWYDSLTYPQSGFAFEGNVLHLSKIGDIKIWLHRKVEGAIKRLTIRRSSTKKMVCLVLCRRCTQERRTRFRESNWYRCWDIQFRSILGWNIYRESKVFGIL